MLKIINITSKNDIINMEVLIEGDIGNKYKLCVDSKDDVFPIVESEIPDKYKIYERQARIALRRYPDKIFPDEIVSSWY